MSHGQIKYSLLRRRNENTHTESQIGNPPFFSFSFFLFLFSFLFSPLYVPLPTPFSSADGGSERAVKRAPHRYRPCTLPNLSLSLRRQNVPRFQSNVCPVHGTRSKLITVRTVHTYYKMMMAGPAHDHSSVLLACFDSNRLLVTRK